MTHIASLNCAAIRSSSATVVRTMCASQNFTACRPQSSSLIAKHPVSGFRGHELVGDDHLHIRDGEQVSQQRKKLVGVHGKNFSPKGTVKASLGICEAMTDPTKQPGATR